MMYESIRTVHAASPAGKGGASGPLSHTVGALPAPREHLLTPHRPHEAARQEAAQGKRREGFWGKMAPQEVDTAYSHKEG